MAIIGTLSDIKPLFMQNKKLDTVFNYLELIQNNSECFLRLQNMKLAYVHVFDINANLFALEQKYLHRPFENAFYESHKKFVDFQFIVSGSERMRVITSDVLVKSDAYNSDNDVQKYENADLNYTEFVCKEKDLAIFFPNDIHMPSLPFSNKLNEVIKTVVKVPVVWFNND